jgi:hypothetical protein
VLFSNRKKNVFTWIDASAQVILPFIIMVICNVNIIHKVLLTKSKTNGKNLKRLRKIKGMCIMIVTVSIIFFVLEAPVLILICLIQGGWVDNEWPFIDLVWTIVNLMMYTNHVINFFTYCMAGTKFRRELLRLLCVNKIFKFLSQYKLLSMLNNQGNNSSPLHTAGVPHGRGHAKSLNPQAAKSSNNRDNRQQQQQQQANETTVVNDTNNNNNATHMAKVLTAANLNLLNNMDLVNEKTVCMSEMEGVTVLDPTGTADKFTLNTRRKMSRLFAGKRTSMNINIEVDYNNNSTNITNVGGGGGGQLKPVNLTSLIVNKKALIGESAVLLSHHQSSQQQTKNNELTARKKSSHGRTKSSDSSDDSSSSVSSTESFRKSRAGRSKKSQDAVTLATSSTHGGSSDKRKKSKASKGGEMNSEEDRVKKSYRLVKGLRKKSGSNKTEKRDSQIEPPPLPPQRHVNISLPSNDSAAAATEHIRLNPLADKDDFSNDKSDGSDYFLDYIR